MEQRQHVIGTMNEGSIGNLLFFDGYDCIYMNVEFVIGLLYIIMTIVI